MFSYSARGVKRIMTLRDMDELRLEKEIRGKNIRHISNLNSKAPRKEAS